MPISSTDILLKYSTLSGSQGNTGIGNPDGSLGKYISTTQIPNAGLDNLFNDITGLQNAQSQVDYRCAFVHNNHATLVFQNAILYIPSQVAGGASAFIGADPAVASPINQSASQATAIIISTNTPTGVVFTAPTDRTTAVALGNIPAGYCKAIWVKRVAANTVAVNSDGAVIRIEGDSAA